MMRRKVIQLGAATKVISLPSAWIKKNLIQVGEELTVQETGNRLIIGPETKTSITLDLRTIGYLKKRLLAAKYLQGYTTIEVLIKPEQASTIQSRVNEMIGMEVIEQTKNRMVITEIGTQDQVEQTLRRILYLIDELIKEGEETKYTKALEGHINRFSDYALRILQKNGYKNPQATPVYYAIILLLEQIADEFKKYFEEGVTYEFPEVKELQTALKELLLKPTLDKAVQFADARFAVMKKLSHARLDRIQELQFSCMNQVLNLQSGPE